MTDFLKPHNFVDSENKPRKAGFELEFGNISARDTAYTLKEKFGGTLEEMNSFRYMLKNSELGEIKIERDAELLLSTKHREFFDKIYPEFNHSILMKEIEEGIDKLSSYIVPCEIVTSPLGFDDFHKLDNLVEILDELGVQGTQDSFLNAYGLHINPSIPDLTARTLTKYIQSFVLLEDWLIEVSDIDTTRKYLTSFIDPFPQDYCDVVLNTDYDPDINELIDDYTKYNPTRNRALDFLPILCEIDKDRVFKQLPPHEKKLVHGRPAFHYRLPDCKIGDPEWKVSKEWNRWWFVEMIASDKNMITNLIKKWHSVGTSFNDDPKNTWISIVDDFLKKHFKKQF